MGLSFQANSQAIVTSAGKSGLCNFTLCTDDCELLKYTGRCESTTSTVETPTTETTMTVTTTPTATSTCTCDNHGQRMSAGQAIVTSAGKSGLCNFTLCTDDCELLKYTGRCESTTSTVESPTTETTMTVTTTPTATSTCTCDNHGQRMSAGQAIVTSAGKSGLCNFTLCTDDCELLKYTGRCESTTSTVETPKTETTMTVTTTPTATSTCTCDNHGQRMSAGQAIVTSAGKSGLCNFTLCTDDCELLKYTGRCESTTSTVETPTTETTMTVTTTPTATSTCTCDNHGQRMSAGQAIVTSAGKSGLCNFTLCTDDCELLKYTGRCESTTSTVETPTTETTMTVTTTPTATSTCTCDNHGQRMSAGQAIVTSAGKSGLCNFTLCTDDCELLKYTGRCESTTSTVETPTTETTMTVTTKPTATSTCTCDNHGQRMSAGQAIVTSAGKSGLCNFTLCTDDCELLKYTGRCESTTSTVETPKTETTMTVTTTPTATSTCTCDNHGQRMSAGQAIVTSAGKSGLCNFTLCTDDCELLKYTGRCESTTSTVETPTTETTMTVTTTPTATSTCTCDNHGQRMSAGQAIVTSAGKSGLCNFTLCTDDCELLKYTGRCESTTSTVETPTTETTMTVTTTPTATSTCTCDNHGQRMSAGQAIVTSAGKSGLCNFTLCTDDCELLKYTGRCESTTSTVETPTTETTMTVTTKPTATSTCTCDNHGQRMSAGQAIVTSAGKSGLCNFTLCTDDCELLKYTGRCESTTSTVETPTTETTMTVTTKPTATSTCTCDNHGQRMSAGQAIVTSAGKSGLCNFTLCTDDCELLKYTGRCESTTSTVETPTTETTMTVTTTPTATSTCTCDNHGQRMSAGQAIVTSAGKSGLCNFTLCTDDCELLKYTGRCESTTSTVETPTTETTMTVTTTPTATSTCTCDNHGQRMSAGQAIVTSAGKSGLCNFTLCTDDCELLKYTGRCESTTSTVETPTTETTMTVTTKPTATSTCTCDNHGQRMSAGQAIVTSAGKSGLCNFTLCTDDCELLKYTGRCESTTSTVETPKTETTMTVTTTPTATSTCTCDNHGQRMSAGQAIVTSAGKSGLCNFTLCTDDCELLRYTGRCESTTSTVETPTTETTMTVTTTPTATSTCTCDNHGQRMSAGQAIVTSVGKSGLCNFTLCTDDCELLKYTGRCESTTSTVETPTTETTMPVTTTPTATSTCTCDNHGQRMSAD
ncbi:mucin-2-like [Narcine bancroftii]|uniref:mucin-2-like n=1 Tax=Narcine bancroftii TaxID=1343680 RepID=UPI0038318DF0